MTVTGGEVSVATLADAPDLELDVERLSLVDDGRAFPLSKESVRPAPAAPSPSASAPSATGERWRLVSEGERASLYENARALPRAWLAAEAVSLSDEAALQTVRTGRLPDGQAWRPEVTALLDPSQTFKATPGAKAGGEARAARRGANRVDVSVTAETAAVLVLSENYYPGWRVTVDGREAELLRVDYNLRGVVITPGRHEVSFFYRPRSVLFGLAASVLTLLALVVWAKRK